jgi:hypothetical protein
MKKKEKELQHHIEWLNKQNADLREHKKEPKVEPK